MSIIESKKNHIISIDALRGIASLMVSFFHTALGNYNYLPKDNLVSVLASNGAVGVEIFFIISGFIIPYSMYKANYKYNFFKAFLLKRFIRIEPPYLVSIIFVLLLNFVSTLFFFYKGQAFSFDIIQFLLHIGYLIPFSSYHWYIDVYWTLAIEFQFYLLIVLIYPLIFHQKKTFSLAILLIFLLSGLVVTHIKFLPFYAPFFVIGIWTALFQVKYHDKKQFIIGLFILLIAVYFRYDIFKLVAAFFTILFIFYIKSVPSLLKFLGNISYSLYLLHIPISGRFINLSQRFVHEEWQRTLLVFVAVAISVFAAWIFYNLVEKPAIVWAKKIKYKDTLTP